MNFFVKNSLLTTFFAGALTACQPSADTPAATPLQEAKSKLMDRHDTLMARMPRLYELRMQLATPPLKANPSTAPAVRRLLAADAAMMSWMHQYQAPDTTAPAAQRLTYFQEQGQKLAVIEKQMQGTIDSATALVKGSKK